MHKKKQKRTEGKKHTDLSGLVDVTRHNTDLAVARLNNTRAVRSDETSGVLLDKSVFYQNHVLLRDTFSDANNELDS